MRRRCLLAARLLLWVVAVVCLGTWLGVQVDAAMYRAVEGRRLDQAIARQRSAPPGPPAPAQAPHPPTEPSPADRAAAAAERARSEPPPPAPAATAAPRRREVLGRLEIPRLGLETLVAEGVDARTLRRAAGHVPGTAAPGAAGNVVIAGHRDGVFRPLAGAARDDLVVLETPAGRVDYLIDDLEVVSPDATRVLAPTAAPTLTLITCYPFDFLGPAPHRLVVHARRLAPAADGR